MSDVYVGLNISCTQSLKFCVKLRNTVLGEQEEQVQSK